MAYHISHYCILCQWKAIWFDDKEFSILVTLTTMLMRYQMKTRVFITCGCRNHIVFFFLSKHVHPFVLVSVSYYFSKLKKKVDARFTKFCNRTFRIDILLTKSLYSQISYSIIHLKQHHRIVSFSAIIAVNFNSQ